MQIRMLGDFVVLDRMGGRIRIACRKVQGLLAFVARNPGEPHSREEIAALLWGRSSEDHARASLRQALCTLRSTLGPAREVLVSDSEFVVLDSAACVVDVACFERACATRPTHELTDALALYRGPLLASLRTREPAFDEWARAERESVQERALLSLAKVAEQQEVVGRLDEAVLTTLRVLALEPAHEVAHRALMRLYGRLGRRGAARRQFQKCVEVLRDEVGVEPDSETRTLYRWLTRDGIEDGATTMPPTPIPL